MNYTNSWITKRGILIFFCFFSFLFFFTQQALAQTHQLGFNLINNYGYYEHVFYQLSGDKGYKDGNPPKQKYQLFYDNLVSLGTGLPGGFSIGGEFTNFSSKGEDAAEKGHDEDVFDIDMEMTTVTANIKFFLKDPEKEGWNIFGTLGVGWLDGKFDSVFAAPKGNVETKFYGPLAYQGVGMELIIGSFGLRAEGRTVNARGIKTNNDPFDQDSGSSLTLNFSAINSILAVMYRF